MNVYPCIFPCFAFLNMNLGFFLLALNLQPRFLVKIFWGLGLNRWAQAGFSYSSFSRVARKRKTRKGKGQCSKQEHIKLVLSVNACRLYECNMYQLLMQHLSTRCCVNFEFLLKKVFLSFGYFGLILQPKVGENDLPHCHVLQIWICNYVWIF